VSELTLEALAGRITALERTVSGLVPAKNDPAGTVGDEQSDVPEAIVRWLAMFDAIPPITMTAQEEAAWKADRTAQKLADTAAFERLVAGLPGSNP
jgi:hypothetical protein